MPPLVHGTPAFVLIPRSSLTNSGANMNTNWQVFSVGPQVPTNYAKIAYVHREVPASEPLPVYVVSLIHV